MLLRQWPIRRLPNNVLTCHVRNFQSSPSTCLDNFAFAFDIDGVLLKSSTPIATANRALTLLKDHSIPFILLTNGGGKHESSRCAELSQMLGTKIELNQFIQSHTPFKLHPFDQRYKNILVAGGKLDTCRKVAENYGFDNVIIPFDILKTHEGIWPYHTLSAEEASVAKPLPQDDRVGGGTKIDAVYVYHDPLDWGLDSQVILDILRSKNGEVGTLRSFEENARAPIQQVPLYFSNNDLLWSNTYHLPRFGQGAFKLLLEGLYKETTGSTLQSTSIGKPHALTYDYASNILNQYLKDTGRTKANRVYMVGDNPASDIAGANAYGWQSILVETGVFRGTADEALDPKGKIRANFLVRDVLDAVEMVLERESVAARYS